ncbi:hypothetical protein CI109_101879 [Kwoniella shandongensis]|uniref:Uncharacterized protein n=1 Tax=Kwoniella shandongensis TaxID=1734106 RepID=A0AAJ8MVQ2_9TREE
MTWSAVAWITYAILIIQAIIFLFFILMLLTKIIEGLIRLFGGVHFDESTHPLDGGLFAAIMDLDCLNPVRGGKAAARKRRKRGSRQLQRNVSAAGSLATQMMLDRHSQGVTRPPVSEGSTPFLGNYPPIAMNQGGSYFPALQPPLGPPPLERHSSESRSDEKTGGEAIMDAWQPSASTSHSTSPSGYAPPGGYVPSAISPVHGQIPTRSFSVVRGGRADYDNPYDVLPLQGLGQVQQSSLPPGVQMMQMPTPSIRVSQIGQRPMSPPHSRQKSSHAIVELVSSPGAGPSMSSATIPPPSSPPHPVGIRTNNEGLRPPALAIPKRRSLNDLKHDPSPDSQYSDSTTAAKKKAKRRSGGWFSRNSGDKSRKRGDGDSDGYDDDDESDDEPGPSRRRTKGAPLTAPRGYHEPAPFEPVPIESDDVAEPVGGTSGGGWRRALGLGKRKKSLDDIAEQARDENKARKAALAAESGALFAGVEAPTPPRSTAGTPAGPTGTKKGFLVNRRGGPSAPAQKPQPLSLDTSANGDGSASATPSFKVKRMGQPLPTPTPHIVDVRSPTSPNSIHPSPNPSVGTSTSTTGAGTVAETSKRGFKMIRATKNGNNNNGGGTGSGEPSPSSSTFVVHRPTASTTNDIGRSGASSTATTSNSTPMNSSSQLQQHPSTTVQGYNDTIQDAAQGGYPPSSFVPISHSGDGGAPQRPARNPRRSSEELTRGV